MCQSLSVIALIRDVIDILLCQFDIEYNFVLYSDMLISQYLNIPPEISTCCTREMVNNNGACPFLQVNYTFFVTPFLLRTVYQYLMAVDAIIGMHEMIIHRHF